MTAAHRCPVCRDPAHPARTPPAERTCGTVAALLEPGLVLRCARDGDQALTHAVDAAEATARDRLPRARRCRLRRTCCAGCGTVLDLPVRRGRRSLTVAAAGLPVHTIHLDLPLTRCPSCGLDQVPWRSQEDLDAVLQAVYTPDGRAPRPS
ncbi:MAG: hypothetical protein ACLFS9_10170 [Nitriliruptoraceae bacterium]